MKTQELKINVPQGFEIDKENSTFENIIFKEIEKEIEKKLPMSFDEIGYLEGYFVDPNSNLKDAKFESCDKRNINVWKSKELAKASLALNQLIWLRDEWNEGWVADWDNTKEEKYCITFINCEINFELYIHYKRVLSFKNHETADKFAKLFESLILEAKPLL